MGWDVLIIVCGMTSQLLEGLCIAFVITQLEIRVYAGSEYIEGEGDKIPFAFLSEGLLDCYFAGDVNSSRRSQGGGRRQDTIIRIDGKVICG